MLINLGAMKGKKKVFQIFADIALQIV